MLPCHTIDLNADLGEGCGDDAAMLTVVTSASIACGGHAGDGQIMAAVLAVATAARVRTGAHPGYPDRANFGRLSMDLPIEVLRRSLNDQLDALTDAACQHNADNPGTREATISYVKPHGALYHDACTDLMVAYAVCETACAHNIFAVVGPAGSSLARAAKSCGMLFEAEGFADRMYDPDGNLVDRSLPGAVHQHTTQVVEQSVRMVTTGHVIDSTGHQIPVRADTICLHGDTPGAFAHASAVREALLDAGVVLSEPGLVW